MTSCSLALLLLISTLSLSSCGAPDIEDVRDEFTRLIKESLEVNEILFGRGLSGYGDLKYDEDTNTYYTVYYTKKDGRLCAYRDNELGKYVVLAYRDEDGEGCVYKDEEKGIYLYSTELEYVELENLPDTPRGYHHVRTDERCSSLSEIANMASSVYSEDYLSELFAFLFGDISSLDGNIDAASPKYVEMTDESSGAKYLLCADENTCPIIDDGSRVYDYDSMKIAKRSRHSYVNIEIRACGKYADTERGEVAVGWHTVSISFTRQDGGWRLDSATY